MDENLSKQILAMGFPTTRIMLIALAKYFQKEYVISKIEDVCHIQEIGCFTVDYSIDDVKHSLFILLKDCNKSHNLTEQLEKLKPHLSEDKWKEILKLLSYLLVLTRNIYCSIYDNNSDLIHEIIGDASMEKYSKLLVDPVNTTLYLPDLDQRVGIFFENTT